MKRFTYYKKDKNSEPELCSVSYAKKMLKKQGGIAFTKHFDRDGSFQEITPIILDNNANTTYRAKYNH